jgi:hypothetical protein
LEYRLINEVFPGKIALQSQNQQFGKLIYLLQDEVFINGWELYIQDLLLHSKFIEKKPELALLFLENKLLSIYKLKQQIEYFTNIEKQIAVEIPLELFSDSAINEFNQFWFNPIPIFDYLVFNEILDIKNSYLKIGENDLIQFNDFISKGGSHSIYLRQNLLKK